MTYCVGLYLREGLVMLSDTRTNAGVDHISTFGKMSVEEAPGERVVSILTAGNLAITQSALSRLHDGVWLDGARRTPRDVATMFQVAQLVGAAVREVHAADSSALSAQGIGFDASFLVGGQIAGGATKLYLVYSAGNFIEATEDTPFLQIGEVKYGKPILDRGAAFDMPLVNGVKLALISMDGTLRSNLTVGMPIDLLVLRTDALAVTLRRRITSLDSGHRSRSGYGMTGVTLNTTGITATHSSYRERRAFGVCAARRRDSFLEALSLAREGVTVRRWAGPR